MPVDLNMVDLDQPIAFSSQEVPETPTAQPPQGESGQPSTENPPTSGGKPVVEDQRVPYSRLQEVIERRREAERQAEEWKQRYDDAMARDPVPVREDEIVPGEPYKGRMDARWVALYGDNDNSRRAYGYELERQNEIREQIRREALEAVREDRQTENQILSENERTIDARLDDLQTSLGRKLNEDEEDALLDIVDEYTPKNRDGTYSGDLISMDKAYEIYSMRRDNVQRRATQSRKTPTVLTSTRTEGEPTGKAQADKDWNPLDWNSYKKRIPQGF